MSCLGNQILSTLTSSVEFHGNPFQSLFEIFSSIMIYCGYHVTIQIDHILDQ